jgi:hypothetical protein
MANMLSADEIARIKAEEILRNEIRKELAPPPPPDTWAKKFVAFLNSPFGMWFLSAVVLATLVNIYNNEQAKQRTAENKQIQEKAEEKLTAATRQRLLLEISYRFSSSMARLKAVAQKYGSEATPESQLAIAQALAPMQKPSSDELSPLYLEYKNFSGVALIAELQRHVGDAEKINLTEILRDTSIFLEEHSVRNAKPEHTAQAVATGLLQRLRYSKWSQFGFPYTTCKDEMPFC